jgi:hypothetical protein
MKYFEKKATSGSKAQPEDSHPTWATKNNASLEAWKCVEKLKKERTRYIKSHQKVTDFLSKSSYQIKPSEVAKAINLNRTTLMHTSTYSEKFTDYLKSVNLELAALKKSQTENATLNRSRGSIRDNKDRLVTINSQLKQQVQELEQKKIEEVVKYAFDQLPLPVKKKLGID